MITNDINFSAIEKGAFVKESFDILHDAYLAKKLVLFVGAGVDNDSGLPLWSDAIKKFCQHMNITPDEADNLKIPQFFFNSRGKKEYVELCQEIFCYKKELPINELHKKIVELNVNTIITTNYTDFLELEMRNQGHICRTICQDKDIPYTRNEKLIIKMHGDFEHDNFVLKEDDYLRYSDNFRLIETYIKALIAKSVVLFIGYSYNDPDTRQMFSWVKSVLGNDFQQAYMLEGYKDYDENTFAYYRNLGVNVIYTNSFAESKQTALLLAMDMVKSGTRKNLSDIETAREYFRPLQELNYVLGRYLEKGLGKCGLLVETNVLRCFPTMRNNSQKLTEELAKRILRDIKTSNDTYGEICNILKKSRIDIIEVQKIEGKEPFVKVPHEDKPFMEHIIRFDYDRIREEANHNELFIGDDEQANLQQAYIYYILKEYIKAYLALCTAATEAFRKRRYYIYYIAQFNKSRIWSYIERDNTVSEDIRNKIREDIKDINLNNIIMETPDLAFTDNQVLKDIDSFQFHFSLFQDAYRVSEKVKEQQETQYFAFSKVPDYYTLRAMILDYYKYISYNYLMIDDYREIMEVFALYLKSLVGSVAASDKVGNSGSIPTKNIHAKSLNFFEIFLMIRYLSEKQIENMFYQYSVEVITTEDDCCNYIKIVLKNLQKERGLQYDQKVWNCLAIISYMSLDNELAENAIDCISKKFNIFVYKTHKKIILRLLSICHRKGYYKVKQEGTFNLNDYALGRFLSILLDQSEKIDKDSIPSYTEIVQQVSYYYYITYGETYDGNISGLLDTDRSPVVAKIYPYCGDETRKTIKEYFLNQIQNTSWEFYETYCEAVLNEIIEPDETYEQIIIRDINESRDKSEYYRSFYQNILIALCNLYINDKLVCYDIFKEIIKDSDDPKLIFLSDMENFDYNKFNIEWLFSFPCGLLEEIAQRETVKTNICKKFAEQMENGQINPRLLKLYFRHFVN